MALASIFNIPETDNEWNEWTFSLQGQLRDINRRLLEVDNVVVPEYIIDPLNRQEPGVQLYQLQLWMNDINATLNISGFDYVDVDLSDKGELTSWIFLLSNNIQQASNQLGV